MYQFDRYRPRAEWFQYDPRGIHGLAHAARVLVWADRLAVAGAAHGENLDVEVVRWAATLHDLGRRDDGRDPQHGERSAAWIRQNWRLVAPSLTAAQVHNLDYCCRWHVPPDQDAPAVTAELRCLKDGDGLDRARLGDLKPELLRSDRARELIPAAEELYQCTACSDEADPWQWVRAAAIRLDLWR